MRIAMKRANNRRIKKIFHSVIALAPEDRSHFLDEACRDDKNLRVEVEKLLDADESGFPEVPAIGEMPEAFDGKGLASGQTVAHFKIREKIGAGGMGEVFLADDTKLDRTVAIKFLNEALSGDADKLNRFIREAKAASALNHPNILTVYEIGVENGVNFIATEFIDGHTLRETLRSDELTLNKLLSIAVQTAEALATAHEAGIIHRDIKPENIMIRRDGYVKVLDFGLAKLTETRAEDPDLEAQTRKLLKTSPGLIMGTACYMSPEQTRGLADIDARADVWSFGAVLFEMFAGRPPFEENTVSDLIASILKTETPPLSRFVADCPPELERIVTKALKKDRDERYQSMKDLALDLRSLQQDLEISSKFERVSMQKRQDNITAVIGKTATEEENVTSMIPERLTARVTAKKFSTATVFLILLGAALVSSGIWWFSGKSTNEVAALKSVEIVSWSSSPGEVYSTGSFSPDASMIAFTSAKSGNRHIWLKQTGAGEAVQVTKDEFKNESPIWSPDGERLAFFSTRGKERSIWQMPKFGGSAKLVAAVEDGSTLLKFWSARNLIYYESKNNIFAVDVNSEEVRQITDLSANAPVSASISLAPDEEKIAYVSVADKIWAVWTKSLRGGEPKKLVSSETEIKNVVWHPDNRRILYSTLVDDTFQIFVTDLNAAPPKQISFGERDSLVLDVSSDGEKILYGSAKEESDIWGVKTKDATEFRVASDINSELWANASPDGKSIAYQSIKNLSQGNKIFNGKILTQRLNSEELPNEVVANAFLPVWSPDGQQIAFMRVSGDEFRIETVKALGGGQKILTSGGVVAVNYSVLPYNRIQTSYASWSSDSSKIAYIADRNGNYNIWIVNSDGSSDLQLTGNEDEKLYLYCPLWSSDGKHIAFTSKTGNSAGKPTYSLWIIDVESKNARIIAGQQTFFRLIGWLKSDEQVVMASTKGSEATQLTEVSLIEVEVGSGKTREITVLKDTYAANIQMSPDKKSFAFAAHQDAKDNIFVTPVSGGEAKKVTDNNDTRSYFSSLSWSPDSGTIFFGKQTRYSLLSMLTNFK